MADGTTPTNALAKLEPHPQRSVVLPGVAGFDGNSFDLMQRLANVMARSTLVPDQLRKGELNEALANCFLVVNQAHRWGMDPFAVAQSVSVISGKLCYEGKLVAAVLAAKLGVRLRYEWDDKPGDKLGIVVSGNIGGITESIAGTVAEWKTTRSGSPWIPSQYRKMLAYRGAREWARLYAPEVMLGIYTQDELGDIEHAARSEKARDITPPPVPPRIPKAAPKPAPKAPEPEPAVEMLADQAGYLAHLEEALAVAANDAELQEAWTQHLETTDGRIDRQTKDRAEAMYEAAGKRIKGGA